jgi:hypothetical protein
MARARPATSPEERVAHGALCADSRFRWCARRAVGDVAEPQSRAVALCAAGASGLKPPAVALNRLRP